MLKLLTATVVSSLFVSLGLPSQAQRLPPPFEPPPLPSPSRIPDSVIRSSLGVGDFGNDVAALQQALVLLDVVGIDPGPIDGAYGPSTEAAVAAFQQLYDLPVTGVAGPETLDILGINVGSVGVVVDNSQVDERSRRADTFPYVAAVTESSNKLGQVRQSFGNAAIDYARSGEFINIGRYNRHSDAADRVREARRLGFEARVLYRR